MAAVPGLKGKVALITGTAGGQSKVEPFSLIERCARCCAL